MTVYSAVVSETVEAGFADLAQAAGHLPGQEVKQDRTSLTVHGPLDPGLAGAIRFSGTLRTSSPLLPSVKVEVVVSPWSAGRSEVAIHPLTHLGDLESFRARRFFNAARSILPLVIDRLSAELPVETPVPLGLAA
ncbi:MAG TPA: hypothetical protein VLX59_18805 [Acidimicrobiales bacterium]|nr:hypothetical protein [Acidimicrobiales bacterium]